MNDEIMEEVHAIKDALGLKFNYDLRLMFEDIQRGERELRANGFDLVPPPANPANLPNTALQRTRYARR